MRDNSQKTKVTAENLKKVLKGDKTEMSNEDATRMLQFLRKLARIAVKKYLER